MIYDSRSCLEALENVGHEAVPLQLLHPGVAHGMGALPLAGALDHAKKGVKVKGHQSVGPLESCWGDDPSPTERVTQRHDGAAHGQVIVVPFAYLISKSSYRRLEIDTLRGFQSSQET